MPRCVARTRIEESLAERGFVSRISSICTPGMPFTCKTSTASDESRLLRKARAGRSIAACALQVFKHAEGGLGPFFHFSETTARAELFDDCFSPLCFGIPDADEDLTDRRATTDLSHCPLVLCSSRRGL